MTSWEEAKRMNKKSLFHITKRDALPWYQAFAIRGAGRFCSR